MENLITGALKFLHCNSEFLKLFFLFHDVYHLTLLIQIFVRILMNILRKNEILMKYRLIETRLKCLDFFKMPNL